MTISPRRWRLALLLAAVAIPAAAGAQAEQQLWRFVDGQGGFCVWYLSDPALAPAMVPLGTALRPARSTEGLPDLLVRITQDEPRFADWIPGVICVGLYAAAASDGTPAARMEDGPPVLITLAAVAAERPFDREAGWLLSEIGLDAGSLDRVASRAWIRTGKSEMRVRSGLAGEDDQWELRLDGLRLYWQGHPGGEGRVGSTRMMLFGYAGNRNSVWSIEANTAPQRLQPQFGSLRIEGKSPMAQALKSSPIRLVGALESGGDMTLSFTRLVENPD